MKSAIMLKKSSQFDVNGSYATVFSFAYNGIRCGNSNHCR